MTKEKTEEKKNEVAVKEKNAVAISAEEQAILAKHGINADVSGFGEVDTLEDIKIGYLRLLQKEQSDIEDSFGGALVETIENKVLDIRKTKGKSVEIIPLYVSKDFEVYEPKYDGEGLLHNKEFGAKKATLKRGDPFVVQHKIEDNRKGTRRSYICYNDKGEIEYLMQQCNKVYVMLDGEFYCMSLRNSKITFFKEWNTVIKRKRESDKLPEFYQIYKLSSAIQQNNLNNTEFWNFEAQYAGRTPTAQIATLAEKYSLIKNAVESGRELDTVGDDSED